MKRFEGILTKDSLEDISEKSEEDSGSKRHNHLSFSPRIQKMDLIKQESAEKPQGKMVYTESSALIQEDSHPGHDTLEEIMDKQKFFSDLEQNISGTLDYGFLNQQLSKTASGELLNVLKQNENSPILISENTKNPSEISPNQAKPSLLSKVSLMDSMGSSLNTTGTSLPAEIGNSPIICKEQMKDNKDAKLFLPQKECSGTVTSQEMEDLQIALQNIGMSSTQPLVEISSAEHQSFPEQKQLSEETQIEKLFETVNKNQARNIIDTNKNTVATSDIYKNSELEPSTELNVKDSSLLSSYEQPAPVVFGFDLTPAVIAQSPDHDLSTSVAASVEVGKRKCNDPEKEPKTTIPTPSSHKKSNVGSNKTAISIKKKTNTYLPRNNDKKTFENSQKVSPEKENGRINNGCLKDLEKEVEFWKTKWEKEKEKLIELKGSFEEMETGYKNSLNQQKQMYEMEIIKLKKSNFVLSTKESKMQGSISDPAGISSEELAKLQKELSEQQVLLSGYQTENERLYNKMKQMKVEYKLTEDRMFRENQKILMEFNSLKNQKEFNADLMQPVPVDSNPPASDFCATCGKQLAAQFAISKISQLEYQKQQAQENFELAKNQNSILEKTQKELESQINLLIQQKEEMRQSMQEIKMGKSEELQVIELKLKDEKDEMKKKLQWYAYNQQLLDQDVMILKQKDKEIENLNKKIEQLQSETGRRLEENKLRLKEKSGFQSRIQDLERQVREMERIFLKRNPNSLAALFLAAGNMEKEEVAVSKDFSPPIVKILEEKIKKLESELEVKENMEEKRIRSVEQKYNKLKFQYESQIESLEQQIHHLRQKCAFGNRPHTHQVALEKELESVREKHQNEKTELQKHLDQLQIDVDKMKKDNGLMHAKLTAAQENKNEIQAHNQLLRKQLETSNQQVTLLRTSISKLQQKKKQEQITQHALTRQQTSNTFDKKQKAKTNDSSCDKKKSPFQRDKTFEKLNDVLEENESLKIELDHLQMTIEQQKLDLYKTKAESENIIWKMKEKNQIEIDTLKLSHQQELQQIQTEMCLKNSSGQIPELMSKVNAQKILINHLKEQLNCTRVDNEKLSTLKIREVVLENQVQLLKDQLQEAKQSFSPDRRHFENLVNKIQELESKHSARENELQNIIKNGLKLQASDLVKELNKWKWIAENKNQDIENYRLELDSILSILQNLQKQRFLIPAN